MWLKNGYVFTADYVFRKLDVRIEDGRLLQLEQPASSSPAGEDVDLNGSYLIPGLIDLHIHGFGGINVMTADEKALNRMSLALAEAGVTSFAATTTTLASANICQALRKISLAKRNGPAGARIQGAYLEGPFISPAKKGAMQERYILEPDPVVLQEFLDIAPGLVKIVAIAPERAGASAVIRCCAEQGVVASIAHTTASYEQTMAAIRQGAGQITHLFNAMPGLHHREPGPIGAAIDNPVSAELICDGRHIHPSVLRAAYKMLGCKKIVMISDAIPFAGLGDGEYEMDGIKSIVRDGLSRLEDGTINGNVHSLADGLRSAVSFGIPLEDAIQMATINPARALGIDAGLGSIEPGKKADLTVLNRDLTVGSAYVDGRYFHHAR